jgi:hypothetical protein
MKKRKMTDFSMAPSAEILYEGLLNFEKNIFYRMALKKMIQDGHPAIILNKRDKKHVVIEVCPKDAGMSDERVFVDIFLTMSEIKTKFDFNYGQGGKTPEEVIAKLAEKNEDFAVQRYASNLNGYDQILDENDPEDNEVNYERNSDS